MSAPANTLAELGEALEQVRIIAGAIAHVTSAAPVEAAFGRVKTFAVDFDGPLHDMRSGGKDGSIYDQMTPGAKEALAELLRANFVYILSTREPAAIIAWLGEHAPELPCAEVPADVSAWVTQGVIGVTQRRLVAAVVIDDRAERFTGNWRDICNRYA